MFRFSFFKILLRYAQVFFLDIVLRYTQVFFLEFLLRYGFLFSYTCSSNTYTPTLLSLSPSYVFYPKSCKKNMFPSAGKSMTYFQVNFGRLNVSFDTVTWLKYSDSTFLIISLLTIRTLFLLIAFNHPMYFIYWNCCDTKWLQNWDCTKSETW